MVVPIAAGAAVPIDNLIGRFKINIWTVALICLTIFGLGEYSYQKKIAANEYEMRAAKTSGYMQFLQNENLNRFFVEEVPTSIYVDYFLTTQRRNYEIHYGFAEPFDPSQKYDCVILKSDNPLGQRLEGYELVYADDNARILIR